MSEQEISAQIMGFIRERFLEGDQKGELQENTPLLEWGVLNSMNTALLLLFIRQELGTPVPARNVNAKQFRDVRSITAMVVDLASAQQMTNAGTE